MYREEVKKEHEKVQKLKLENADPHDIKYAVSQLYIHLRRLHTKRVEERERERERGNELPPPPKKGRKPFFEGFTSRLTGGR